ncbi:hypothetical protein Ade02nite_24600 [Paractinoplanes deccanensis]|uniref:Uncharacterized protein n=1 Tax=Paractinoplanes deccanensis TaxID=113561 RepID=A0ABQ3Y1D6_9ACTN|nr:hypothetical protein [Actinoplanes deccanensis]GID73819.1 hypothetical protein Ade02nite_24600 [Actinoplanes deccanensis]
MDFKNTWLNLLFIAGSGILINLATRPIQKALAKSSSTVANRRLRKNAKFNHDVGWYARNPQALGFHVGQAVVRCVTLLVTYVLFIAITITTGASGQRDVFTSAMFVGGLIGSAIFGTMLVTTAENAFVLMQEVRQRNNWFPPGLADEASADAPAAESPRAGSP